MPGSRQRSHHQIFNFVRVQALDKLSQILAYRHRGTLFPVSRKISPPVPAESSGRAPAHPLHRLPRPYRKCGPSCPSLHFIPFEQTESAFSRPKSSVFPLSRGAKSIASPTSPTLWRGHLCLPRRDSSRCPGSSAHHCQHGIAEMMVGLYRTFAAPLTDEMLFAWHTMLTKGRRDLKSIGRYRTGAEPIEVVSGSLHAPKVHFEAPPSSKVAREMARFVKWFNRTAPSGSAPLPALTRAGMAHLYFESIHPFEDGNAPYRPWSLSGPSVKSC